jgi:hypothetical protein
MTLFIHVSDKFNFFKEEQSRILKSLVNLLHFSRFKVSRLFKDLRFNF